MDNSIGDAKTIGSNADYSGGGYSLNAGDVLGQYRIIKPLGKGGMGEVYLAENTLMRKQIALKLLPRAATGGTFVDRFRIEARVMADLLHPNIVQVYHAGEENGQYYLTMDYVVSPSGEPQTLEEYLAAKGKLPEAEVKHFALQICDALELAHGKELVHRDLKPSNILLQALGNRHEALGGGAESLSVKITDFGLAKVVGEDYLRTMIDRSLNLSMVGDVSLGEEQTHGGTGQAKRSSARAILGTYEYMAPEQKAGGVIAPQTDLYAIGIILYRLLTGEKPEGLFEMPSELGCSEAWDGIVRQCMQKRPEKRPASARALREELNVLECGGNHRAMPASASGVGEASAPPEEPLRQNIASMKTKPAIDLQEVEDASYAPLSGTYVFQEKKFFGGYNEVVQNYALAEGSAEAQARQKEAVGKTSLPLEVQSTKTGIKFRLIPAGSFAMGSPSGEPNRDRNETQHQVTISKPFYCGTYEVTQAQWKQVMGNGPSKFQGLQNPVEQVSWDDCQTFLKKLCKLEGVPQKTYRLLTEAQWEYACRAGTQTPFCYGSKLDSSMANFDGNYPYGGASKGTYREKTTPVGQFKPNAFGLYDMHGNVWEWCSDWYSDGYGGSVVDPVGPAAGSYRVYRGGSWSIRARSCRSALRGWNTPVSRLILLGFRLQRTIPLLK